MSELVPKIADISTLKGISMLLALPMICVAYTFQTGLEIFIDNEIWLGVNPEDSDAWRNFKVFIIFILKSLWISFFAAIFYGVLTVLHEHVDFPVIYVSSVILIAIALLGIFGQEKIPELKAIDRFWFYAFIVWGVYLQTIIEKFEKNT